MAGQTKYCKVCRTTKSIKEFYGSNNREKYPDGKLDICKKCITMNVDNWDPKTYLPILQECDVPYIPRIWNKKLANYGQDRSKVTGMTIIGRYLSTMKIKPNDKWRWKDTEYLQEIADHELEEAMKRQGYATQEIDKTVRESHQGLPPEGEILKLNPSDSSAVPVQKPAEPQEDYFDQEHDTEIEEELSDEDRRYLRLKWGKAYKPEEWVRLEQLYTEMTQSYDIQGAGHEDVLKLVCKTSLKANQLLDIGDVDGAQKMVKMYDSLMKSGKFTAAQNKTEEGEYINSISEFVALCEKEGFIPRYYTDGPQDRVDETIKDMNDYTRSLVVGERNLGNLIENAVKQMAEQEAKEEDEDIEDKNDDNMTLEDVEEMTDKDFTDFEDFVDEETEDDEKTIKDLSTGHLRPGDTVK